MLLASYRFGAHDVQNQPLDPKTTPVLVLASARYMDGPVQQKLVDYLKAGGGLLLYGEVPLCDMEGHDCTTLADALGLTYTNSRSASAFYYLSLAAEGWIAPRPEVRTHHAQGFESRSGEVLLRVVGTGEACGFDIKVGKGRAIVLAAAYTSDVPLFRALLEKLGAPAALAHDCPYYGIFLTSSASESGERFLHLLNLDGLDKTIHLTEHGRDLLEGRAFTLRGKDGVLLPLNVSFGDVRIVYATAEVTAVAANALTFRLTQPADVIALDTNREIVPGADYTVEKHGKRTLITSRKHAAVDDQLTVQWR
jgi:beta-galactosidase